MSPVSASLRRTRAYVRAAEDLLGVLHQGAALDRTAVAGVGRDVAVEPVVGPGFDVGMPEVAHHVQRDRRAPGRLMVGADSQHARLGVRGRADGEAGLLDG
jgi:hypothetical protein